MKKLFSSKLRGITAFSAFSIGLFIQNGIQAHGGHVPAESELLHYAWHTLASVGTVVAILLVLGVFFIRRGRQQPTENR